MNHRCALSLATVLFLAGLSVRAEEPAGSPTCADTPACKSIYMQARQQSEVGNLSEALRLYRAAYEVQSDPAIFFSIGRVLQKQGQLTEASSYFQRFIDSPVEAPDQKRRAADYLKEIQAASIKHSTPVENSSQTFLPSASSTPSDATTGKPVYKRWWFWTAIGGGVLAVTAIGLGVGLSQQRASIPFDPNTYEPSF